MLRDEPERVSAQLGQSADPKSRPLWALNTAWFEDGVLIEVEEATEVETPIEIEFIQSGSGSMLVTPRCLILMGRGSRATVRERYRSTGTGPYLTNALSEAILESDASLLHLRIQEESDAGFHLGGFASRQGANSRSVWDDLPDLRVPTLAVTGDADVLVPPENSRILADRIPNAELRCIEGGGHIFFMEQPEATNTALLDFFARHPIA